MSLGVADQTIELLLVHDPELDPTPRIDLNEEPHFTNLCSWLTRTAVNLVWSSNKRTYDRTMMEF